MNMVPRPHDLLVLAVGAVVQAELTAEQSAVAQVRMVVVRRGAMRGDLVPVGVRGLSRAERFAGWLSLADVQEVIAPEDLRLQGASTLPALSALGELQQRWANLPRAWGPVGSVGFALASGADVVTGASDLDVLLRAPGPLDAAMLRRLKADCQGLSSRVDVQVVTPLGSVALEELGADRVMLRDDDGMRLVEDPWLAAVAR